MSSQSLPQRKQDHTALLVIDVQQALFQRRKSIFQAAELLANINLLIDRAHQVGVPIFFIQHTNQSFLKLGSPGWQLHPSLHWATEDKVLSKRHGSAFRQTQLQADLDAREVRTVIVTGLVTHGCVQATCRDACKLGYQVVLAEDGHSNWDENAGRLIAEWNERLAVEGVAQTRPSRDILFEAITAG